MVQESMLQQLWSALYCHFTGIVSMDTTSAYIVGNHGFSSIAVCAGRSVQTSLRQQFSDYHTAHHLHMMSCCSAGIHYERKIQLRTAVQIVNVAFESKLPAEPRTMEEFCA